MVPLRRKSVGEVRVAAPFFLKPEGSQEPLLSLVGAKNRLTLRKTEGKGTGQILLRIEQLCPKPIFLSIAENRCQISFKRSLQNPEAVPVQGRIAYNATAHIDQKDDVMPIFSRHPDARTLLRRQ